MVQLKVGGHVVGRSCEHGELRWVHRDPEVGQHRSHGWIDALDKLRDTRIIGIRIVSVGRRRGWRGFLDHRFTRDEGLHRVANHTVRDDKTSAVLKAASLFFVDLGDREDKTQRTGDDDGGERHRKHDFDEGEAEASGVVWCAWCHVIGWADCVFRCLCKAVLLRVEFGSEELFKKQNDLIFVSGERVVDA